MADVLFLLKTSFADPAAGPGQFYCPGCATVSGLLSYFPAVRERLHVRVVDFPRPRNEVQALLGPNHPGCPVLVLDDSSASPPPNVKVHNAPTGRTYILGEADIGRYLAAAYGTSAPHP